MTDFASARSAIMIRLRLETNRNIEREKKVPVLYIANRFLLYHVQTSMARLLSCLRNQNRIQFLTQSVGLMDLRPDPHQ